MGLGEIEHFYWGGSAVAAVVLLAVLITSLHQRKEVRTIAQLDPSLRGPYSKALIKRLVDQAPEALAARIRQRCAVLKANTLAWPELGHLPSHFVFLVSDEEQSVALARDSDLANELRATLASLGYPATELNSVEFDFLSKPSFERVYESNWYFYWK